MNGSSSSGGFGQGLENILGNPLVQTALAGYLGAIGSPRNRGIGGALSQGGLAALGQFGQAEQLKQQLPYEQARTEEALMNVQSGQQRMQAQKQALDWLDKDPAAQKMDPQQRMILRLGIATGKIDPAMLGLTPYQTASLAQGKQRLDLEDKRYGQEQALGQQRLGLEERRLGQEENLGEQRLGLESRRLGQEAQGSGHVTIHSIAEPWKTMEMPVPKGGVFEPPAGWEIGAGEKSPASQTPQQRMGKVNTDLRGFLTSNPSGVTTDHEETVDRATKYVASLNPDVPEEQIRATADALVPKSGKLSGVAGAFGGVGGGGAVPATPTAAPQPMTGPVAPANATHEIVSPDGQVAGHKLADGTIQWLPGHEPKTGNALGATGIVGG